MNINHLNQITPKGVIYASRLASSVGRDDLPLLQEEWRNFCTDNRDLIIAALQAALRLKHELSSTKGDEG